MLMADVSGSGEFGTAGQLKRELVTEACATIAFSAMQNNDKVGLILFSDQVELFIPPKKGSAHILRIIRELLEFKPRSRGTHVAGALKFLNNVIKKRSIAFLISDLMDEGFEDALKIANRRHDLVALRTTDPREMELPDMGLVQFKDAESGEVRWVNTASKSVRDHYRAQALKHQARSRDALRRAGVDHAVISTRDGYVKPLMNLFRQRDHQR
ncbi:MAG: VWA domain-containing protein, partial [Flavobacteriales bacterium]|nr:VWA domain-containing protein [Flavobacteriales bacterium]